MTRPGASGIPVDGGRSSQSEDPQQSVDVSLEEIKTTYYGGKKVGLAFQPDPLEKVRLECQTYLSFFFAGVISVRRQDAAFGVSSLCRCSEGPPLSWARFRAVFT